MKFDMILAHYGDNVGLEDVYLEYVKFPMEVEGLYGVATLENMDELHKWAKWRFDYDYEIVTLDTALADPVEGP